MIEAYALPVVEGTHGAYTVEQLVTMPFHQLLDIFEAMCHRGAQSWLAGEPDEYTDQRKKR